MPPIFQIVYTAQDWVLIIGALMTGLGVLGKLYIDILNQKHSLAEAQAQIKDLTERLENAESDLYDCVGHLESGIPPLRRRRKLPTEEKLA